MKTILLSFFIIVLAGCTSVAKPTIHLHSNGVSKTKLTNLRTKLEKSGYTVVSGNQDFSHFLFTPLIVVPKNSKFSTPELQQQITLARKLINSLKEQNEKTVKLINEKMGKIPDVLDSRPKVYPSKVPKYIVKKNEKWTRIKPDGSVEYMDIQPGEWD